MRHMLPTVVVAATVVLAAGCGGPSPTKRAQDDWDFRLGTTWERFEAAYESGWTHGCGQARELLFDPSNWELNPTIICDGSPGPEESFDLPFSPPDEPRAAGYRLGLNEGCVYVFSEYDRDLKEAYRRCRVQLRIAG